MGQNKPEKSSVGVLCSLTLANNSWPHHPPHASPTCQVIEKNLPLLRLPQAHHLAASFKCHRSYQSFYLASGHCAQVIKTCQLRHVEANELLIFPVRRRWCFFSIGIVGGGDDWQLCQWGTLSTIVCIDLFYICRLILNIEHSVILGPCKRCFATSLENWQAFNQAWSLSSTSSWDGGNYLCYAECVNIALPTYVSQECSMARSSKWDPMEGPNSMPGMLAGTSID